ncbi:dTDP-4-dehydrorhamnose reductase [hydrothermal vent metagenome]|uniref:dTDP-4-dehydrorhamnose reductase n=1 Tax=hydrothermal vent metagenome TaxID=652676 RepID=A0A3B0YL36_9ZZZZ
MALLSKQQLDVLAMGREQLNLAQPEQMSRQLRASSPDWIINCAAWTAVDEAEREMQQAFAINRDAVRSMTICADVIGARVLHISTDFVFSGQSQQPYSELDAVEPLGVYGCSKHEGELAVLASPGHMVLRTSWLYGTHGNNFVKTMLRLARDRDELRVIDDQIGSPTWTRDLAQAILVLIQSDVSGLFHFSNSGETSWYGFACAILEEARAQGFELRAERVTPIPTADFPTPASRPAYSVLSTEKIQRLLPMPVQDWRSALRLMLEELKQCPDC